MSEPPTDGYTDVMRPRQASKSPDLSFTCVCSPTVGLKCSGKKKLASYLSVSRFPPLQLSNPDWKTEKKKGRAAKSDSIPHIILGTNLTPIVTCVIAPLILICFSPFCKTFSPLLLLSTSSDIKVNMAEHQLQPPGTSHLPLRPPADSPLHKGTLSFRTLNSFWKTALPPPTPAHTPPLVPRRLVEVGEGAGHTNAAGGGGSET